MSMNPPGVGADLPVRYGVVAANPNLEAGMPGVGADATDSDWAALSDPPGSHPDAVRSPRLLTPAVLRVLEWHRQHSTGNG
ncbi:MAG TPA: hypothetical protein VJO99_10080 [Burkholderiaceae bacterium]|nr:hypothetical protein [Burkholderiaceae bacterium]